MVIPPRSQVFATHCTVRAPQRASTITISYALILLSFLPHRTHSTHSHRINMIHGSSLAYTIPIYFFDGMNASPLEVGKSRMLLYNSRFTPLSAVLPSVRRTRDEERQFGYRVVLGSGDHWASRVKGRLTFAELEVLNY